MERIEGLWCHWVKTFVFGKKLHRHPRRVASTNGGLRNIFDFLASSQVPSNSFTSINNPTRASKNSKMNYYQRPHTNYDSWKRRFAFPCLNGVGYDRHHALYLAKLIIILMALNIRNWILCDVNGIPWWYWLRRIAWGDLSAMSMKKFWSTMRITGHHWLTVFDGRSKKSK